MGVVDVLNLYDIGAPGFTYFHNRTNSLCNHGILPQVLRPGPRLGDNSFT